MLSKHPAIKWTGMDAKALGHQVAEAGRVQVSATANDTVLGQATQFPGHIGQHVHCG